MTLRIQCGSFSALPPRLEGFVVSMPRDVVMKANWHDLITCPPVQARISVLAERSAALRESTFEIHGFLDYNGGDISIEFSPLKDGDVFFGHMEQLNIAEEQRRDVKFNILTMHDHPYMGTGYSAFSEPDLAQFFRHGKSHHFFDHKSHFSFYYPPFASAGVLQLGPDLCGRDQKGKFFMVHGTEQLNRPDLKYGSEESMDETLDQLLSLGFKVFQGDLLFGRHSGQPRVMLSFNAEQEEHLKSTLVWPRVKTKFKLWWAARKEIIWDDEAERKFWHPVTDGSEQKAAAEDMRAAELTYLPFFCASAAGVPQNRIMFHCGEGAPYAIEERRDLIRSGQLRGELNAEPYSPQTVIHVPFPQEAMVYHIPKMARILAEGGMLANQPLYPAGVIHRKLGVSWALHLDMMEAIRGAVASGEEVPDFEYFIDGMTQGSIYDNWHDMFWSESHPIFELLGNDFPRRYIYKKDADQITDTSDIMSPDSVLVGPNDKLFAFYKVSRFQSIMKGLSRELQDRGIDPDSLLFD